MFMMNAPVVNVSVAACAFDENKYRTIVIISTKRLQCMRNVRPRLILKEIKIFLIKPGIKPFSVLQDLQNIANRQYSWDSTFAPLLYNGMPERLMDIDLFSFPF